MNELSITRGRHYIPTTEKVRIVDVRIVEELYFSGLSIAEVTRVNKVGLSSLTRWKRQYSATGEMSVKSDDEVIPKKECQ